MSYLVLSDATKQNLEQERSRLMSDRAKIVSDIEASISAEVDRTLQTLTALLNESPEVETVHADDVVESVTELLDQAATEEPSQSPQKSRKTGTKSAKPEVKETSNSAQTFDAKQLKPKFKGKSPIDAIVEVMQQDSTRVYELDELITALYGKFNDTEMSRARKTLGATLMHANRKGTVERIGEKPSRYKLG